jgi:hypothetical protein
VHFGEIKDGGDKSVLSLDAQGSEKAFDIAISFFDWLEDSSLNIFKERKMKMFQ